MSIAMGGSQPLQRAEYGGPSVDSRAGALYPKTGTPYI